MISIHCILEITGSGDGLLARLIIRKTIESISMLQLVQVDWKVLYRCHAALVERIMGTAALKNVLRVAKCETGHARLVFAGGDIKDFIEPAYRRALLNGLPVGLEGGRSA